MSSSFSNSSFSFRVTVADLFLIYHSLTFFRVTVADLLTWEKKNGEMPRHAIVVMNSGWSSRYPNKTLVFGTSTPTDVFHVSFPRLARKRSHVVDKQATSQCCRRGHAFHGLRTDHKLSMSRDNGGKRRRGNRKRGLFG